MWLWENIDRDTCLETKICQRIEVSKDNVTCTEFGPDIEPKETKELFVYSVISGIVAGLAVPAYLWWLLKKRINS